MSAQHHVLRAVGLSLLAALLFTSTYVLNRAVAVGGGHWAWTAALRYLFMLPLLLPLMHWQGGIAPVWRSLRAAPGAWLGWSSVGFALFYGLLSAAAASGPSWLVAGSFQMTVVAGMLCAPLLYRNARARIPRTGFAVGVLIVTGVLLMQFGNAHGTLTPSAWLALACVLVSAFAYPLGNRGLLLHLERRGEPLNATQRVFGMTLASQPAWWALALWAWTQAGPPPAAQMEAIFVVALVSGVAATILFFHASGMVRSNPTALGAVEAMQASEVVFAALLGVMFLGEPWPHGQALFGGLLVVAGIALFAWVVAHEAARDQRDVQALRSERGR